MERQKIFSLIETQTIISKTSLMVHWPFRRPQFFYLFVGAHSSPLLWKGERWECNSLLAFPANRPLLNIHLRWTTTPWQRMHWLDYDTGILNSRADGFTRSSWTCNVGRRWRGSQSLFHRGSGLRSRTFLWFLIFIFQDV